MQTTYPTYVALGRKIMITPPFKYKNLLGSTVNLLLLMYHGIISAVPRIYD